jgi:hypothetical protein
LQVIEDTAGDQPRRVSGPLDLHCAGLHLVAHQLGQRAAAVPEIGEARLSRFDPGTVQPERVARPGELPGEGGLRVHRLNSRISLGIITHVTMTATPMQRTTVRNTTDAPRNRGMSVMLNSRTGGNTAIRVTTAIFHFGGALSVRVS